ncbi:MAG: helix-turn-helix transcriptional regulator [Spirochaetales bacterium]|nr:helix-turn-helix transcriptional regulator [Spirochaetales bacterium]
MKHSIGLLYRNTLERELLLSRTNALSELECSLCPVDDERFDSDADLLACLCRDLPGALRMKNLTKDHRLLIFAPPNLAQVFTYLHDWRCASVSLNANPAKIRSAIARLLQPADGVMEVHDPIHLTKRERQVLSLILSGQATSEIAKTLGIARATVTTYKKSLYSKSGTNSLSRLLIWAMVRQL